MDINYTYYDNDADDDWIDYTEDDYTDYLAEESDLERFLDEVYKGGQE